MWMGNEATEMHDIHFQAGRLPGRAVIAVEGPEGGQFLHNLLTADIAGLAERLRAAGVTLFSAPVKVPAGVVQFAAGDKTLLYFLDPDGVILELAEYASAAG